MKLSYFRGTKEHTNFGDELNAWMWPKLLPDFFDDDDSTVFLGIGSIIGTKSAEGIPYRSDQMKVVFGSGFVPTYHEQPDVHDGTWDVFFVRGPHTVKRLKLEKDQSIGDSAILLRTLVDYTKDRSRDVAGFMPHWESLFCGDWEAVCAKAGVRLVDPRKSVDDVLDEILSCKVMIAEAMHGAIVADALRVPWVPVVPISSTHRDKWYDWADALSLSLPKYSLPPSSLVEARRAYKDNALMFFVVRALNKIPVVRGIVNRILVSLAARKLRNLVSVPSSMSSDREIENATQRMVDELGEIKAKYGNKA